MMHSQKNIKIPIICLKICETMILHIVIYGHETLSQSNEKTHIEGL